MKTTRTKAIVLRRTNYGEADRVVQMITPDGRRSVMARGVRKEKSKLAGGIELFAVSDVVIGEGKGDLGVLTSAKLDHFYRHILEDYDRLQFGYTAVKLVARASETVDEPEWFDLLEETIAGLDVLTIPQALIEAWFYIRYASLLGHDLNLELDIDGEQLQADASYRYDMAEQGLRKVSSGELSSEHIKLLRLIASRPLKVLIQIGGVGTLLPECLRVVREHAAVDIS
ncbi:DNA repair protein RecO [Candidatus Saccharibacteria bacterium 49-20]|nr:MAG: DNA repair protein RecO [Candidatus Saccharibacteria bacterium 49-20]